VGGWAATGPTQGKGEAGLAGLVARFRPMAKTDKVAPFFFLFFKPFIYLQIHFKFKSKFESQMIPIRKIKHRSTSSHNKICNDMNASNIIIYLSK
jgi:hypothetical protein